MITHSILSKTKNKPVCNQTVYENSAIKKLYAVFGAERLKMTVLPLVPFLPCFPVLFLETFAAY